jgi:hypothetical protein
MNRVEKIADLQKRIEILEAENKALQAENLLLKNQFKPKKRSPKLDLIAKETLENYWWELSDDWKRAFQHAFLRHGETVFLPSEKDLRVLFSTEKLEIVGNGILLFGLEQLSFKLKDLSGLQYFTQLKELNIAGNALKNLKGIEHLKQLELINITANQLTTLRGIRHLKNLKNLFIRDNKITMLSEIQHLKKLVILDCLNNKKLKTIGKLSENENLQELHIQDHKNKIHEEIKTLNTRLPNLKIIRV